MYIMWSLCIFGTSNREDNDNVMMKDDFLNVTFCIDTQVNINNYILNDFECISYVHK